MPWIAKWKEELDAFYREYRSHKNNVWEAVDKLDERITNLENPKKGP